MAVRLLKFNTDYYVNWWVLFIVVARCRKRYLFCWKRSVCIHCLSDFLPLPKIHFHLPFLLYALPFIPFVPPMFTISSHNMEYALFTVTEEKLFFLWHQRFFFIVESTDFHSESEHTSRRNMFLNRKKSWFVKYSV